MIKTLKNKFVILATISTLVILTILITSMNIVNYRAVVKESDQMLSVLSNSEMRASDDAPQKPFPGDLGRRLPPGMSKDAVFESRYFYLLISQEGYIVDTNVSQISSVDVNMASEYAIKALRKKDDSGFIESFRYKKEDLSSGTKITFLDCRRNLKTFKRFLWISIVAGLACLLIVFLTFIFAAGRIIRPISESYQKQKKFITDAGHEIRTPLTIINANLDLLELEQGENEYLEEIKNQSNRLSKLTEDLVYMSKMEEPQVKRDMIDFPFSDLVSETADEFRALAVSQDKNYNIEVTEGIALKGSPDDLNHLVSILLDNAMKYTPNGGNVSVSLSAEGKNAILRVTNTVDQLIKQEDLSDVFDRFHRLEGSRNSQTGGHGIGLSLAKAITDYHGGKIKAMTNDGTDFEIEVKLPI